MKNKLRNAVAAGLFTATAAGAQADGPTLVTVLTAPEPQTQLMAMVLTLQSARQGATPHVLLCGPGGDLALRDAPDHATAGQPPRDASPQGLLRQIADLPGARVEVCAIYLPGRGTGPEVLLDGIGVAEPGPMGSTILAADTVLSF